MPIGTCSLPTRQSGCSVWVKRARTQGISSNEADKEKALTRERFEGAGRGGRRGRWCVSMCSCRFGSIKTDFSRQGPRA
jgi:hypothetical protein